ncbi:DUF503 domain-containing protein [Anaerotignum lactatifermentans]|uniref:DUF503 domain-containing protein n=1 Tax=Anaerotignum lactatifermentans TaxID=160404 RepID=A0ABS2GB99_9FIRM|nr:DUF503 domain-containing protein [Anaerotignum lactatifermentans]MBM6830139.1 DUF503 domain-containing protein [Anaerotignum lactatifermentans]MBM6878716.1 DUF503 domain-containing protein [Anaerotignum lactatifermentans]MBM6951752.1 DUF503 domain-containing protein [Anaerotignum lactatifermentans]
MVIGSCIAVFRAEWVGSLKEKRMVVKSLTEKTRHKFNVSVAEVDTQDTHQICTIGFACVSNESRHADSMVGNILDFMEKNTEAELISAQTELISL